MSDNPQWYEDIRKKVLELDAELDKQLGKLPDEPDRCPTCDQPVYSGPLTVRKRCREGISQVKGMLYGMHPDHVKAISALHEEQGEDNSIH
jgi:hypothetical protein